MGHAVRLLVVCVVLSLTPACFGRGGDCHPIQLQPVSSISAADQAQGCGWTISYEGREYIVSCEPIRRGMVGTTEFQGVPAGSGGVYHIRPIKGVPIEQAVAISALVPIQGAEGCASWGLARGVFVSQQEMDRIIKQVTVPSSTGAN